MSVNNFKPTIWSRNLLFSLKKSLIGLNLVNRDYQGEITNEGDTVRIQTPDAITIGDYTGADIDFQGLTSGTQSLEIDQSKYFAFLVDDVDQAQANVNLMQSFMVESAHGLAKAADTFIFGKHTEAASENVIDDLDFDEDNAYKTLTEAAKRLNAQNVPDEGRWVVVSPEGIKALSNDPAFQRASDLGDQTSRFGFMGMAAGFNVWMSNNLAQDSDHIYFMYGHSIAITFADQIIRTEAGRREKGFSDFVKGLHVYGGKVVRPNALGVIEYDLGS